MSWLEALAREDGNDGWEDRLVECGEEVLLVCTLHLADYMKLSAPERAALVCAALRLRAAQAAQTGRAARSLLGEADVLSELDGGALLEEVVAEEAFRNACAKQK